VVAIPDRFGLDFRVYPVLPADGDSWCSGTLDVCQVRCNLIPFSKISRQILQVKEIMLDRFF
jgi:hypothetical protein